jgi:hypothetical protein
MLIGLPRLEQGIEELILNYRLKVQVLDTRGQGEAYDGVPRNATCIAVYNPTSDQWFYEPFTSMLERAKVIAVENAVSRAIGAEMVSMEISLDTQMQSLTMPAQLDEGTKNGDSFPDTEIQL